MRLLIVEDDPTIVAAIAGAFARGGLSIDLASVGFLDDAMRAIEGESFDLVVCDLIIPPTSGGVPAAEHGRAVYERIRLLIPGTPVILFSGLGSITFVAEVMRTQPHGDPLGTGQNSAMVLFFEKDKLRECVKELERVVKGVAAVDGIELSYAVDGFDLAPPEKRVIRLAARRLGATFIRCKPLTGGLSGSRVFDVELHDADHSFMGRLAAKVGLVDDVRSERERFQANVPARLPPGAFATFADLVTEGCGSWGGIFYGLANGYPRNLFELAGEQIASAVAVVQRLQTQLRPWVDGAPISARDVGDVRRMFLSDANLPKVEGRLNGRRWRDAEGRQIQARRAAQHGDLHGANILVNADLHGMLIDFSRVGSYTAATDPTTLELCVFFHPQARTLRPPSIDAAALRHWSDGTYADGTSLEPFTHACRNWASGVSAAEGELAANAYGYAMRQLAYVDVDPYLDADLALAVIDSALAILNR